MKTIFITQFQDVLIQVFNSSSRKEDTAKCDDRNLTSVFNQGGLLAFVKSISLTMFILLSRFQLTA